MHNIVEQIKSRYGTKGILIGLGLIVLAFLIVFSYFGGTYAPKRSTVSQEIGGGMTTPSYPDYEKGAVRDSIYPPEPGVPPSTPKIPTTERKVIQNGSLDLLVQRAEEAILAITGIATNHKGFVENSNVYEVSEGVKAGTITIRIPSTDFAPAMEEIKKLAIKVQKENTNSQDVTAQFVDLEAQLKNYKAEEEQYRQIMAKAVKIEDVLNVAQRLAEVRGRIEQTQGQLNYLSRQVDMSTISVSLTSEAEVQVFGIVWRPLTVIKQAFKALLESLVELINAIIFFLFGLPVLIIEALLVVFVIWLLWKVFKWARRKFNF